MPLLKYNKKTCNTKYQVINETDATICKEVNYLLKKLNKTKLAGKEDENANT